VKIKIGITTIMGIFLCEGRKRYERECNVREDHVSSYQKVI
jgi:hypothetical protein